MGSITISLDLPGAGGHHKIEIKPCANLNCTNGSDGNREIVFNIVPLEEGSQERKFCGKACRWEWNNKRGKVR